MMSGISKQIKPWDPSENIRTSADAAEYLAAIFEETDDPKIIQAAIGDIARSRGMTEVAKEIGVSREGLYKSFSPEGNPSWQTVFNVLRTLGLRIKLAL